MSSTFDTEKLDVLSAAKPMEMLKANWGSNSPLVSVICVTYNHAGYLSYALSGMLMQRTRFPFEVLVFDDASTDGSSEVIRDWESRYPSIVRSFLRTKNQFQMGVMPRIFNVKEAKGKYLAICDGDDFWTDPMKLQRQIQYLENNENVAISGHNAVSVGSLGEVGCSVLEKKHMADASAKTLMRCDRHIMASSMVFRNISFPEVFERDLVINGDSLVTTWIGSAGSYHYHHDIGPVCYRQHDGGVWSRVGREAQMESHANLFFWLACYYKRHGDKELGEIFEKKFITKKRDLSLRKTPIGRSRLAIYKIKRKLVGREGNRV